MPAELLITPPTFGKTQTCIQKIRTIKSSQPLAKVWVLVPDHQKATYFRRRLAASGGGIGVSIGTFRNLYLDILERNGVFLPVTTPALEHRLVQETIEGVNNAGELIHYASIKDKPGFILALQDCFAELRGSLVRPDHFLEYSYGSTPARHELALLYKSYINRLQEMNWTDQEGQSWLAVSLLENNPTAADYINLLIVDGFTSFTGARRTFLKLLSQQVGEMLVTLPGKIGSTRQVHRRSQLVQDALLTDLSPKVSELTSGSWLPPVSRHLESNVLNPGTTPPQSVARPFMVEARSQSDEAREALRWIKALNIRENLALESCAVFTSNLDAYKPLLRAAALEFGIKVHFSKGDALAETPAILALLTLLHLPAENYKTRAILNTLHSPYFDFGLDSIAIENLERVSQEACIVMGREQWEDAWRMLEKSRSDAYNNLDDDRRHDNPTVGVDLNALKDAFEDFWQLFSTISAVRSLEEWIAWLEILLDQVHFFDKVPCERDQAACESLSVTLKSLVLSEKVAGVRQATYSQFLEELLGVMDGARLDESRESSQNAVLIGDIVEARGSRFKAVALMGFSEGLFPAVENPDPFLDEELRHDLGLEPRLQREQASIFYQAFTRADVNLLITRPYLSEDGEPWEPSPYWLAAKDLFTDDAVVKFQQGSVRSQADAASSQELLFWGIQQNFLAYPDDSDLISRWQALAEAQKILSIRRSKNAYGIHQGNVEHLAPILSGIYSSRHIWSASRLEEYGTCPYKFYIGSVLKLISKTPPELGLNAAQVGTIYHRILELVYMSVTSSRDSVALLNNLENVAESVFRNAPLVYGFRPSPLWEVEKQQIVESLRHSIQALENDSHDWTPIQFEMEFGIGKAPALLIDIGSELVQVHGVIDRVDRNAAGQIRVIDYKTGSTNLDKADLKIGRRLQLPIYAQAAQEALQLGEVVEGFYWKIREAKASTFKLSTFESDEGEGPEAAYQTVTAHIGHFLTGIRTGIYPSKPPRGGCPEYCPAVQWCWHYQAGF